MTSVLQDSLTVAVNWAEALQGAGHLDVVSGTLATLLRADAIIIARIDWTDLSQKRLAIGYLDETARQTCSVGTGRALKLFGKTLQRARDNTIWSLADMNPEGLKQDPGNGIIESYILCLHAQKNHLDVLELHFLETPLKHNLDLFRLLTPELAAAWRRRLPGAAHRKLRTVGHRSSLDTEMPEEKPLLDPENPAGLSRSEFRICMLFGEGHEIGKIAKELSITVPTVRSHLSRIYSKTQTAGQVELIQRLHRDQMSVGKKTTA